MPELPEVETIARALKYGGRGGESILGFVFKKVMVYWERSIAKPDLSSFSGMLVGQRIIDVQRRGKFIIINLSLDNLLIHLRMSGDLRVDAVYSTSPNNLQHLIHDRVIFDLDNGHSEAKRLVFNDPRKFGRIWLVREPNDILGGLGPEPLAEGFLAKHLYDKLSTTKRAVKQLLMDQAFLAGLGNIYADEALFVAGIHPFRQASSINLDEAERLWSAIREVLTESIRRNGASIDWVYRGGDFQNNFKVYQRSGEPCLRCGTKIERIVIGQRGTHFCPVCQW